MPVPNPNNRLNNLKKEVADLKRFNQIVMVLTKYGFGSLFGELFGKLRVEKLFSKKKGQKKGLKHLKGSHLKGSHLKCSHLKGLDKWGNALRLRKTLEKLGPTFIKLGQILSLRPDLLSKEYIRELSSLQDKVPSFSYEEAEDIIKKELKKPIDELFQDFSKKPIASASISQVHKARLKNGQIVAVKIQRPDIKKVMQTDIEIMMYIAGFLEKHSKKIAGYKPLAIVQEFREWTEKELNFGIEAENAKRFYKNFRGSSQVKIPKVFDKYSTAKVLTLEFIDGIELHNISKLKGRKGYNIREIMRTGFDSILTQVFIHGFFHADPHPGNILVIKGNRIALVDFGIVGYFDSSLKQKSLNLLYGIVEDNADTVVNTFLDMGLTEEGETDLESFREEVKRIIEPLQTSRLKDVKVSYVLEEVLDLTLKYHIRLPLNFVLFGKTLVEIEGIALEYEPDFKFVEQAKPFIEKLIKKETLSLDMAKDFVKSIAKYGKLIRELPEQLSSALIKIQKGTVKVDVEDTDIKRLAVDIDKSSNRLIYGMLITALLITGALLVDVGQPVFYSLSLASLLCFAAAFIFGAVLFVSILREER